MPQVSIQELTQAAAAADHPSFAPTPTVKLGGVDPLGLRQLNFDLMDEVLPGLNNVARHIRPFVVVTWAWRRAHQLAKESGNARVNHDDLLDFVDRVEVLYVVSQVLNDPEASLPGKEYLKPFLREKILDFEGPQWQKQRKVRRYSTALSAPINYGPGLKALGWLIPHPAYPSIMMPTAAAEPALTAFEKRIGRILRHESFQQLEPVNVSRDVAESWGEAWSLTASTDEERVTMSTLLFGAPAPVERQLAGELLKLAVERVGEIDVDAVRRAMSGAPAKLPLPQRLVGIRDAWRRVQVRQLFRLSLEAILYWLTLQLEDGPRSIDSLVSAFVSHAPKAHAGVHAQSWISSLSTSGLGPTELIRKIQDSLFDPDAEDLVRNIAVGLAFSLIEPVGDHIASGSADRLPLARAQQQARTWSNASVSEFVRHILELWVLAQHAYWSVGRGLADARSGGKILLRLKVILDEGGWTLTPGTTTAIPPRPTRDRLATALSLAVECDYVA